MFIKKLLDLLVGLFISHGATKEQISAIASKTIRGDEDSPDEGKCPICLGDYVSGEEIRILQCTHTFHAECVDSYVTPLLHSLLLFVFI
jgi:hypothetical protein